MFNLNREQHYKITMDMEDNIFLHFIISVSKNENITLAKYMYTGNTST